MYDWFEDLFGFPESSPEAVHENIEIHGDRMMSVANGRTFGIGTLSTPSLGELRAAAAEAAAELPGQLKVANISGDAGELHCSPDYNGALFQVASQFNLLEMVGPDVTPEEGIAGYAYDSTQGPSCAMAAAPATLYRNYFVPVGQQSGQTSNCQIDCLRDVGAALGNEDGRFWRMSNGYALCKPEGLTAINEQLNRLDPNELDSLRIQLRIGIHSEVQVTHRDAPEGQTVSQAYCSALPVGYSQSAAANWTGFAQLVLNAAYEATLAAAVINAAKTGSNKVLLTRIGGGVFGNDLQWIHSAMERAFGQFESVNLEVLIVSYNHIDPELVDLAKRWNAPK